MWLTLLDPTQLCAYGLIMSASETPFRKTQKKLFHPHPYPPLLRSVFVGCADDMTKSVRVINKRAVRVINKSVSVDNTLMKSVCPSSIVYSCAITE
jgi:hypothetical protein